MAVACLKPMTLPEETQLKLLQILEKEPDISQRRMAEILGVSLGKTHYCLKALVGKGLVKANNFKKHNNKLAYTYYLTPHGIDEKARITLRFLKYKIAEYEVLKEEIERLRGEVELIELREESGE